MPVIRVDILQIMQGTALQACAGGVGSYKECVEKDGSESKDCKAPFHPFMSSSSSALLFRWSLMAASSDLNGTGPWRC